MDSRHQIIATNDWPTDVNIQLKNIFFFSAKGKLFKSKIATWKEGTVLCVQQNRNFHIKTWDCGKHFEQASHWFKRTGLRAEYIFSVRSAICLLEGPRKEHMVLHVCSLSLPRKNWWRWNSTVGWMKGQRSNYTRAVSHTHTHTHTHTHSLTDRKRRTLVQGYAERPPHAERERDRHRQRQ